MCQKLLIFKPFGKMGVQPESFIENEISKEWKFWNYW